MSTAMVTQSLRWSFATTIANDAVTPAKTQNVTTASVLARNTAGTGDPDVLATLPSGVHDNITGVGTLTSRTWNTTAIGAEYGGTGQTT